MSFVLTDVFLKVSKALSTYIVEPVELAVVLIFFFLRIALSNHHDDGCIEEIRHSTADKS